MAGNRSPTFTRQVTSWAALMAIEGGYTSAGGGGSKAAAIFCSLVRGRGSKPIDAPTRWFVVVPPRCDEVLSLRVRAAFRFERIEVVGG
jgi:hypothetical protein